MIVLSLLVSGCLASTNSYQTAETLEPEEIALGVALGTTYVHRFCMDIDREQDPTSRECLNFEGTDIDARELWTPNPQIVARFGLMEGLDLGVQLQLLGLEADLKYQFLDLGAFAMSVGGAIRVMYSGASILEAGAIVPVLATLRPVEWFAIYGGGKALLSGWGPIYSVGASDDYVLTLGVAAVAGLSFDFGDIFFIRPEATYNRVLTNLAAPSRLLGPRIEYLSIGIGAGASLK